MMNKSSIKAAFQVLILMKFYLIRLNATSKPDSVTNNGDEVGVLLSFKQSSIQTDPRGFLANWSSISSTPCSWSGVTCSDNGRVYRLDFTNAALIGHLCISDLTQLPTLTTLLFSENSFDGNLSYVYGNSCNLETVDLSANKITDLRLMTLLLSSCRNLNLLNFSSNKLDEKLESAFSLCRSLRVLCACVFMILERNKEK